jgi:dihydroxyacid dehydratase/phosphogluconate dehydratase
MEAGTLDTRKLDLIDAMVMAAIKTSVTNMLKPLNRMPPYLRIVFRLFTANSMNSLAEAIGLALPETAPL